MRPSTEGLKPWDGYLDGTSERRNEPRTISFHKVYDDIDDLLHDFIYILFCLYIFSSYRIYMIFNIIYSM